MKKYGNNKEKKTLFNSTSLGLDTSNSYGSISQTNQINETNLLLFLLILWITLSNFSECISWELVHPGYVFAFTSQVNYKHQMPNWTVTCYNLTTGRDTEQSFNEEIVYPMNEYMSAGLL